MKWFKNMLSDEDGQGMVEYGLLIALIAIVVIVAIAFLGNRIKNFFENTANALPGG